MERARNRQRGRGGTGSATGDAARALARRPLCEEELRRELSRRGHAPADVERTVERLRQAGQLDDLALARHQILARAERLGYGRRRLLRELAERGVSPATAGAAWERLVRDGDLDPDELLRRAVARRLAGTGRPGARSWRRIYNSLLRAGFERSDVIRELGGREGFAAIHQREDGHDDEFA